MLNEEKIKLMAKAASYEAGEGKKALSMNKYFSGDFISLQLIGAWISFTVAYALCVGLWAFYRMEDLMENINKLDLPAMGKGFAFLYLGLLGIFLIINYVVYRSRYQKNRKSLAVYYHILKRISHIYQVESRSGMTDSTSQGAKEDDDFTGI
jgi:hypothetical protein